ncbi:hypothetical protein HAX54_007709, partial [Datura stramonium]|nr:hypothetical protein [Datura stramonium]
MREHAATDYFLRAHAARRCDMDKPAPDGFFLSILFSTYARATKHGWAVDLHLQPQKDPHLTINRLAFSVMFLLEDALHLWATKPHMQFTDVPQ